MRIVAIALLFILTVPPAAMPAQDERELEGKTASQWADALADDTTREAAWKTLFDNVPRVAPILPAMLNDPRPRVWQVAVGLASRSGPAAAASVPGLRRLLADPHAYNRVSAASALGHIGPAAAPAAPEMIRLLDEKDEDRRIEVARSLWRIGRAGSDALVCALRTRPSVRMVEALGRGGEQAVAVLVPLLDDNDPSVRQAAADALVLVGWTAIPALERIGRTRLVTRILDECHKRHFEEDVLHRRFVVRPGHPLDFNRMSVDWETGRGHGRNLSMYRFRSVDGGVRVDRIHFFCPFRGIARLAPISVASASMDAARGRAMLRALDAAFRHRLEETPESRANIRMWGSSNDFHSRMLIKEGRRDIYRGEYTGRTGSSLQKRYVHLRMADSILDDAVKGLDWTECMPSNEVLEWLLARTGSVSGLKWWVEERLLLILRGIADARFVPFLETIISRPLRKGSKRTELYAIDAYARLTGVDLRPLPFTEKEVPAAQERYLRHFADQRAAGDSDR